MNTFTQIAKKRKEVQVINLFRSIPVTSSTIIAVVYNGTILLRVSKEQIICLQHDGETFIKSDELKSIVKANVDRVNFANSSTVLSAFEYVNSSIENRQTIRVEPAQPIHVLISHSDQSFNVQGEIADISVNGISVFLPYKFYSSKIIRPKTNLNLSFQLPLDDHKTLIESQIKASIVNVIPESGTTLYRIGMQTNPDENIKDALTKFVAVRQQEINQELKICVDTYDPNSPEAQKYAQ